MPNIYEISNYGYTIKVLDIGASLYEYSLNGHNIIQKYEDLDNYKDNPLYMSCIVGRTAGRIKGGKYKDYELLKNYKEVHNHHGNDLHLKRYDVSIKDNKIICKLFDPEGIYPGNAYILVTYYLTKDGLVSEIKANSDKQTLFNFTNHTYFNLEIGNQVLDHTLKIDANYYAHLDNDMFVDKLMEVSDSAFDFRVDKKIGSGFNEDDNKQFDITRYIDHPFKLSGDILYQSNKHSLNIKTSSDYVVIYTANFMQDNPYELKDCEKQNYNSICFECQKIPGDLTGVYDFYQKTSYILKEK